MRILKSHGLTQLSQHDIFNATIVSRLTYAVNGWQCLASGEDIGRMDKVICKVIQLKYCLESNKSFSDQAQSRAKELFEEITGNSAHVLHHLLPPPRDVSYDLHSGKDHPVLPRMCSPHDMCNFVIRMSYGAAGLQ